MTVNENESTAQPGDRQPVDSIPHADSDSWFADLFDLRVIVFLVSVTVIAMTATVLMLSREHDQSAVDLPGGAGNQDKALAIAGSQVNSAGSTAESDPPDSEVVDLQPPSIPSVTQESDGRFLLPTKSAMLTGCRSDSIGLSDWQPGGSAQWRLAINDRRTGLFYCFVTYQANFESQFAIQTGDRSPLKFTIYPHDTDFTEQFIVRLDQPNNLSIKLICNRIEPVPGVTIKQIRLVPR